MIKTLDQLASAFSQNDNQNNENRPNNYYPFWKMSDNQQAIVRFLPDLNDENPMGFCVEKRMHTLTINGENKSVPCLTMYGEDCPICELSRTYYNKEDKVNGKKYWRKKQHIAQAIIVEDPLPADDQTKENHEGKVRFIALGYQLFNIIKSAFESGDLDEIPYAFEGGTDFVIKKSKQGDYSTYAIGSNFSRRSRDLTEDELAVAQEHMVDLSTMLPQHPGLERVESQLAAAQGLATSSDDSSPSLNFKPKAAATSEDDAPLPAADPAPVSEAAKAEGNSEADEILARIRARKGQKAE